MTACATAGKVALEQRHPVRTMLALLAATGVQELCRLTVEPRVSAKLDIAADVHGVLRGLGGMAVLRLYDVDGSKSEVGGAGLVTCFRSLGAVNEVKVTCVNMTTGYEPTKECNKMANLLLPRVFATINIPPETYYKPTSLPRDGQTRTETSTASEMKKGFDGFTNLRLSERQ